MALPKVKPEDAKPGVWYAANWVTGAGQKSAAIFAGDGLVSQTGWAPRNEDGSAVGEVGEIAAPSRQRSEGRAGYVLSSVLLSDSFQFVDGTTRQANSYAVGRDTEARAPSNLAPKQEEARKALLLSGADPGFVPEQRSGASRLEDEPQFLKRKLSGSLAG